MADSSPNPKPSSLLDLLLYLFHLDASDLDLLPLLATSAALLLGCLLLLLWRRSANTATPAQPPRRPPLKLDLNIKDDDHADDGKKRVTIFSGTQTGTAEGFAKAFLPSSYVGFLSCA